MSGGSISTSKAMSEACQGIGGEVEGQRAAAWMSRGRGRQPRGEAPLVRRGRSDVGNTGQGGRTPVWGLHGDSPGGDGAASGKIVICVDFATECQRDRRGRAAIAPTFDPGKLPPRRTNPGIRSAAVEGQGCGRSRSSTYKFRDDVTQLPCRAEFDLDAARVRRNRPTAVAVFTVTDDCTAPQL